MHVLVVGGSGLLGRALLDHLAERGHEATGTHATDADTPHETVELDKTDEAAVTDLIAERRPDAVVDTAAYHDVDGCETNRERAWTVNAAGTATVARAAADAGAHYQFISTSYVFDGEDPPYVESDSIAPPNYYAETKYAGERVAKLAPDWSVVRTDVLYGHRRSNFATWALGELRAGNQIGIVDDQISTPTYAPDLARACLGILESGERGLYHGAGPERCSRYEFTVALAEAFDLDTDLVEPITTTELGQEAPRPPDCSLDSSALTEAANVSFRPPREGFAGMRTAL